MRALSLNCERQALPTPYRAEWTTLLAGRGEPCTAVVLISLDFHLKPQMDLRPFFRAIKQTSPHDFDGETNQKAGHRTQE